MYVWLRSVVNLVTICLVTIDSLCFDSIASVCLYQLTIITYIEDIPPL